MYTKIKRIKVICFLILAFSLNVSAPCWNAFTIYELPPVNPFEKLVNAVGMVETMGNTNAFNPVEGAIGIFQIRPIRILDYNRRTGSRMTRYDLFDYENSRKVFLYYASQIGPYNIELIARNWNGSGHHTNDYWDRVKRLL